MTHPATNAQVALQCATTLRAANNLGSTWNETFDLLTVARRLQRWLDTGDSPPRQFGELA